MLLSKLKSLFEKSILIKEFKEDIQNEISAYKKNIATIGSSSPIFLTEDIDKLYIRKEDIIFLCDSYIIGIFNEWELNYIAENILLSERIEFNHDEVEDALLALTDPEYFKLVNVNFVKEIIEDIHK